MRILLIALIAVGLSSCKSTPERPSGYGADLTPDNSGEEYIGVE